MTQERPPQATPAYARLRLRLLAAFVVAAFFWRQLTFNALRQAHAQPLRLAGLLKQAQRHIFDALLVL